MRRFLTVLALVAAPALSMAQDTTATKAAAAAKPTTPQPLTLTDLLTWKSVRSPQVSNDGKWFAYVLAPNEGDADVVIRSSAAEAKEMKFPVGEAPAGAGGLFAFAGAGMPMAPVSFSGNGKWAAFAVYPKSADTKRARRTRAPRARSRRCARPPARGPRRIRASGP